MLGRLNHSTQRKMTLEKREIRFTETGFQIIGAPETEELDWGKVTCVNAFKRDLFSVDLVCFEFFVENKNDPIEINEQMPGFNSLDVLLAEKLSGFDSEWRIKVIQPAFATNLTKLWQKP